MLYIILPIFALCAFLQMTDTTKDQQ